MGVFVIKEQRLTLPWYRKIIIQSIDYERIKVKTFTFDRECRTELIQRRDSFTVVLFERSLYFESVSTQWHRFPLYS